LRTITTCLVVAVAVGVLAARPAGAQGFMVKPMHLDVTARPGERIERRIELTNTRTDRPVPVRITTSHLGQAEAGWQVLDGEQAVTPEQARRSCRDWVLISPTSVTVQPTVRASVDLVVSVPRGARGFYCAAVLPTTQPREPGPGEIAVALRFLVLVTVNVLGVPARESIGLDEVEMSFVPGEEGAPGTTKAGLRVTNDGETYVNVSGNITVLRPRGDGWQRVMEARIADMGIIPAVTLTRSVDLGKRLPSGRYKLVGEMSVGGRPRGKLEKEIDFQGDPTVTAIPVDVPLVIEPPSVEIDGPAGARRSAALLLRNPTEEPVRVDIRAATPKSLGGVMMGTLKGEQFAATEWLEIRPDSFSLRGGAQRAVRIVAMIPAESDGLPFHYTDLEIATSLPDGQSAGSARVRVTVEDKKVEKLPRAAPVSMRIAEQGPEEYSVTAKFGNVGNVHWAPKATGLLQTPTDSLVAEFDMETSMPLVLPLGTPEFTGTLNLRKAEPGLYYLVVSLEFPGGSAANRLPLQVELREGRKVAFVPEVAEEPAAEENEEADETPPAE